MCILSGMAITLSFTGEVNTRNTRVSTSVDIENSPQQMDKFLRFI